MTPKFLLSVRGGEEKYPLILASKASCLCRFSPWKTCTLVLAMEEMVDITGATCRTWVSIKVPYSFCFQLITGAALHNSVTSSFPFISFDSICERYSGYFPIFFVFWCDGAYFQTANVTVVILMLSLCSCERFYFMYSRSPPADEYPAVLGCCRS